MNPYLIDQGSSNILATRTRSTVYYIPVHNTEDHNFKQKVGLGLLTYKHLNGLILKLMQDQLTILLEKMSDSIPSVSGTKFQRHPLFRGVTA